MEEMEPVLTKAERRAQKHSNRASDMARCPICNALSYPRVEIEEDKAILYCKSCGENMTKYYEAIKEFQDKYIEIMEEEKRNDPELERVVNQYAPIVKAVDGHI